MSYGGVSPLCVPSTSRSADRVPSQPNLHYLPSPIPSPPPANRRGNRIRPYRGWLQYGAPPGGYGPPPGGPPGGGYGPPGGGYGAPGGGYAAPPASSPYGAAPTSPYGSAPPAGGYGAPVSPVSYPSLPSNI